jgi:acyl dehydratase
MSDKAEKAFTHWQGAVGKDESVGDWLEVTQDRINQFADVTEDHQFIHVDPERAKDTPFGGTIAHGFLTLSLLVALSKGGPDPEPERVDGVVMGINYGFDKIRFINPVKAGKKVRAHSILSNAELKGSAIQITRTVTVEIEGEEKPALVADWLTRLVFA